MKIMDTLLGICLGAVIVTAAGAFGLLCLLGLSAEQAREMRALGYDAELIGFNCYIRYHGVGLPCSVVLNKQLNKIQLEINK